MQDGTNFKAVHTGPLASLQERKYGEASGKFFIGETMGLTGSEISLNRMPSGKGMPFVHAHQQNEEVYIVTKGTGKFYIDGEEFPISEGSVIRVDPKGERAIQAGSEDLYFICIQAQKGSLKQATRQDGTLCTTKASWMK